MHIVHERVAARVSGREYFAKSSLPVQHLARPYSESCVYPLLTGAYVELEPEAVVVSRKLFPVPRIDACRASKHSVVTRLLPQARVDEPTSLSLPLKQFDPYRSFEDEELIQWVEKPLMFELGYFLGAAGTEELGRSFPTDHGPRPGFDVFTEFAQMLVRTDALGEFPIVTTREERKS